MEIEVTPEAGPAAVVDRLDQSADPQVYFPVPGLELASLRDWSQEGGAGEGQQGAVLAQVNNTELAIFRYGERVLATAARCPHLGGPLHLGDIEVLPDQSLCVRCPWHRWAFTVGGAGPDSTRRQLFPGRQPGQCVSPPGRSARLDTFPATTSASGQVRVGFSSFHSRTLTEETF